MRRCCLARMLWGLIGVTIWCTAGYAAPVKNKRTVMEQPDGSYVDVIINGDEYFRRIETPDGYTLTRDPISEWLCFADLSEDKSMLLPAERYDGTAVSQRYRRAKHIAISEAAKKATIEKAYHLETRAGGQPASELDNLASLLGESMLAPGADLTTPDTIAAAAPVATRAPSGHLLGLTILMDFPDVPATFSLSEVDNLLNAPGYSRDGNNGSARDYFGDVSDGMIDYENTVVGYYTTPKNKSNYETTGTVAPFVRSALESLDADGFDFSKLTVNENNEIVGLNVFYAGAWADGDLWPHAAMLSDLNFTSSTGVKAKYFTIQPMESTLVIGTFCHETGHLVFHWPDCYDRNEGSSGLGGYCLMAYGGPNTNPVPPNGYLRYLVGWEDVEDITLATDTTYVSSPNSNQSFLFANPNQSREFFMIESRKRRDRNAALPDEGLMVWHIDASKISMFMACNDEQMTPTQHYGISLEQADGRFDLERDANFGDADDLFNQGENETFDADSTPGSLWWNGMISGLEITEVRAVGDEFLFSVERSQSFTIYTDVYPESTYGRIVPFGDVTARRGEDVTFTFVPVLGIELEAVYIDGAPLDISGAYTFHGINADHDVEVYYNGELPALHEVYTNTVGGFGSVTPGTHTYVADGEDVTLTFIPDEHYVLNAVTVDGEAVGNDSTLTIENVTSGIDIIAQFVPEVRERYTVTLVSEDTKGRPAPLGTQEVPAGSDVVITIDAFPGYDAMVFRNGGYMGRHEESYLLSNISRDEIIELRYRQQLPGDFHTISSAVVGNGAIDPAGDLEIGDEGEMTYFIKADAGYDIAAVRVDGADQGSVESFTFTDVMNDHTIEAEFQYDPSAIVYDVVASSGANGSVEPPYREVEQGWDQTVRILPDSGYRIAAVYVDNVDQGAAETVTFTDINDDHSVYALFEPIPPTTHGYDVRQPENGLITPTTSDGTVQIPHGGNLMFSITPRTTHRIEMVGVNGIKVGAVDTYTLSNVQKDGFINAVISPEPNTSLPIGIAYDPIPLPVNCTILPGSTGVYPVDGNFLNTVQPGDLVFADTDGPDYAVEVFNGNNWWLQIEPYSGAGGQDVPCSMVPVI